jgi:hypothetical protein
MVSDDTNPGVCTTGKRSSRPVHFTVKEWVGIATLMAMGVGALFFLIGTKIDPVARDLTHHVTVDDQRDTKQSNDIDTLENGLHRIELKQERLAPAHRVRDLPANLRAPLNPPTHP